MQNCYTSLRVYITGYIHSMIIMIDLFKVVIFHSYVGSPKGVRKRQIEDLHGFFPAAEQHETMPGRARAEHTETQTQAM